MKKKIGLSVLSVVYILYSFAISTNNNMMGDILSPALMFIISVYVFYGLVIKQEIRTLKWPGFLLSLSVFSWFICDLWWGIQTLVLHSNPEKNIITVNGYSLTNLFLFLSIMILGYQDLKKMNKIKAMLDTLIISICIGVLLWLFVFQQKSEKMMVLLSNPVSMASLLSDIIIYAWINIWAFSIKILRPRFFEHLLTLAALIFVVTDFIYYYMYFYSSYNPNSWIDGAYMIAFSVLAISVYVKGNEKMNILPKISQKEPCRKLGVEILSLSAPLIVFILKRNQIQYIILLMVSLLIYYVVIYYTQKSIFQEKLLELEKRNVSELEKKVEERTEEIIRILNTDFVTGLYSRRYFESKLSQIVKNINNNEKVALLFVDQNNLKAIKYLYGKDTAEKLLKRVADWTSEIVSANNGIIAAYGDDVFVTMINGYDAHTDAKRIAEQILSRCNELFFIDNHKIRVTLNIGISCYPLDTSNAHDLVRNADIAMMQARAEGFNRIQLYNDKIGNLTYSRQRIELKLKKVVFDKEFQIYFQPQVYCKDGNLCGFETLIRWNEGGNDFISPEDFIPIAEEIGMIIPLGYWIIENAAKQHAAWKTETGSDFRISVNVSSKQLVEVDFVERLHEILNKYNISPEKFEIEITESQQIENSIDVLETLKEIKKLGISIAIDDFGTGYSSLYYIKNIPTDRIKIPKELIDKIENDAYSNTIVQMVISIAKVKGIKVIVEGVETKEQWECLKELGCDEIQGYYFSKPISADEVERDWLCIN